MALVAYSDSETSDVEDVPAPKPATTNTASKASTAGFRTTEARKIRVDLPALKPEAQDAEAERPAKRARVGCGGFNSSLPAPKRTAESRSGLGRGVSLKTSSEVAFSREGSEVGQQEEAQSTGMHGSDAITKVDETDESTRAKNAVEPKMVGRATKFKPLSVQAGRKKKIKKPDTVLPPPNGNGHVNSDGGNAQQLSFSANTVQADEGNAEPPPKSRRSLFSVPLVEGQGDPSRKPYPTTYEAITTESCVQGERPAPAGLSHVSQPIPSTPLEDITADLDLTPAQRRQIFGRNGKANDVNIARFNMDTEYASNEVLRQSGETVEHKAVKSIAPGKHSLQQLVNNAKSQQENLEDKWAEGRRERGEGSSRYGWGR